MEEEFLNYLEEIFALSEISNAKVRNIVINRATMKDDGRRAFEAGYHDCYSDVDLSVKVCLPMDGSITAEDYMKRIERFDVTEETALGVVLCPPKSDVSYDF